MITWHGGNGPHEYQLASNEAGMRHVVMREEGRKPVHVGFLSDARNIQVRVDLKSIPLTEAE